MRSEDDTVAATIRLCTVPVMRFSEDFRQVTADRAPGWATFVESHGPGATMMISADLPEWLPPIARGACILLRQFGEFTPQQAACANAALATLLAME